MCAISFALVAAASALDQTVAEAVRNLDLKPRVTKSFAVLGVKSLGVFYWSTIPAAIVVAFLHRWRWRASAFILMTGLVCLLGNLMKWIVGRTRPFRIDSHPGKALPFFLQPFRDGWEGLITQRNLAFPSGHTMVAFATAAGLAILWPRWRWFFYFAAALVAAERVMENAHWLSDTVGAAGLAICGVHLMWRIILPWVTAPAAAKLESQPALNLNR
jgi:membrane-associated phospholipid phosphatase